VLQGLTKQIDYITFQPNETGQKIREDKRRRKIFSCENEEEKEVFVSVKVKLTVVGKKKQRTYRIVAIDSRNPRDGEYLEKLGWYNPRTKELKMDEEGIMRWHGKGAILSERVESLLKRWRANKNKEVESVEGTNNIHS